MGGIENYPDKAENILQICLDAELLYNRALDLERDKKKREMYEEKLGRLKELMNNTPFNIDIYELFELWIEIRHRSWRDHITLNQKQISKANLRKFFLLIYQNVRYDLIKAGFKRVHFGGSGIQPTEEEDDADLEGSAHLAMVDYEMSEKE